MRRRGFIINSTVVVLLIPILLLSAVYSQVHFQISQAQGEKMELEKLRWAISYVESDLKNTVQISGRRALLAMVNYTVTSGTYLTKANETMRTLMLTGQINGVTVNFMGNQTLGFWLNSVSNTLLKRGLIMEPPGDLDSAVQMEIVPLTSFQIAIKVRINNVTIRDLNGKVVYRGSLPPDGYVYSILDLNNVEDPVYALATNGQYHRVITACEFPYPEVSGGPVSWITGLGNSSSQHIVGTYGEEIEFNSTDIWVTSPPARLFNLSANPLDVFNYGDRGYLYFSNVSVPVVGGNWGDVSTNYNYRVNFTLTNYQPNRLTLLVIDTSSITYGGKSLNELVAHTTDSASILIYDSNGNPVPFWIEYWGDDGRLWLWIKTTDVNKYSLYFSDNPAYETRGYDTGDMFYLLDDFRDRNDALWHYDGSVQYDIDDGWLTFTSTSSGTRVAISNATFGEPFFVRWGMNASGIDAGVGLYRPPEGGGQNYLDVVVRYDGVVSRSIYWPYNRSGRSSVSSLNDIRLSSGRGYTRFIYSLTDAQTAKRWLDEQLARINGTTVYYENYQIPIYLNATQVQGINYDPATNSAAITIVDDRGNPVPFWIEYWGSDGALIWVKVNLTERYYTEINQLRNSRWRNYITDVQKNGDTLSYVKKRATKKFYYILLNAYIGAHLKILYNTGSLTRGDGDKVFEFFDDFNGNFLSTSKWNVESPGGSYSISNSVLTLKGDNDNTTSDVWLWTKKTFPASYVIGMKVYISRSAAQGWLWYIDNNGVGWMEDVYYDSVTYFPPPITISGTFGHLYTFNVVMGEGTEQDTGGEYTSDTWSYVEIGIYDYSLAGDHYADITTYQDKTPFVWNWSNQNEVSYYDGFFDDIYAKDNTAVGLAQFMGSTKYDFIYVRKYLDLSHLSEDITKHEALAQPTEYEATGSTSRLALWKNWNELKSGGYSPWGFNRYELNVSSSELALTRITGTTKVVYDETGAFTGLWNLSLVARGTGTAKFDWVIVGPPYVNSGAIFSSQLESPGEVIWNAYSSVAFDLQPFLNCLANDTYFGVYEGPSLFERLEGKLDPAHTGINGEYWEAARKMQEKLGIARDGNYYPIGLVSFIYYPVDDGLLSYLQTLDLDPNDAIANSVSFADYYWLSYYFASSFREAASPETGHRVWGVSMGTGDYSYLSGVGFLMDDGTATSILGSWAWNYLRYGG